jgi:hypothetical protein
MAFWDEEQVGCKFRVAKQRLDAVNYVATVKLEDFTIHNY